MMTSIRMKPWLSNRMKFVIVHGSLSYRLFLRDNYLYSLYSAFTNHVTITLQEGSKVRSGVACGLLLLCLCAREGLSNFSSLLCDCITTRGGRHCIVGVWVKDHWWLLGTHHVIRSCCQSHDLVSRSNITMNGLMLNSSIIFTFGFRLRLWLTYAPCQMMFIRQESVVMKLHFNCHYECTIWIFYQVWFLRHAYCWYFIHHKHPFYVFSFVALGPYVSMGIVACLGQLPAISNDWTDLVLINIIVRNIHQFLSFVYQWEWGFNSGLHPLCTGVRFLGWGWPSSWLLLVVLTMFSSAVFSC
mgnify:FL=1